MVGKGVNTIRETKGDAPEILSFLRSSFSSPTHWPDWNIPLSEYFNTRFFYQTCWRGDQIIGICPCHEMTSGLSSTVFSGPKPWLMPYGGWLFSEPADLIDDFIQVGGGRRETIYVSLPSIPEFGSIVDSDQAKQWLTLVVDLRQDQETIWMSSLNAKRRNMIRKAEKANVQIVEDDKNDLASFYDIMKRANERNGLNSFELTFFSRLFSNAQNIAFDILWAKNEHGIIAGLVMARDKNFALYWLGMTIEGAPNMGQGDLLQWRAICRAKEFGCAYYDLCSIEKEHLPQIYEFKKGFSSDERTYISFANRPLQHKILDRISR